MDELRSRELMLTPGKSDKWRWLPAGVPGIPGKFKFKFMEPRLTFKLLPFKQKKTKQNISNLSTSM